MKKLVDSKRKIDSSRKAASKKWFAFIKAQEPEDAAIGDICDKAGIARSTYYTWTQDEGFEEWLTEQVSYYRKPIHQKLQFIAENNLEDYRFWEAMAKRTGFISEKPQDEKLTEALKLYPAMTKEQAERLLKERGAK